jgi:class 3 adenylate cyclase/tetratricopeptide (TPR) repeat protein
MLTCPNCGRENVPDARFCSFCGTALSAPEIERREERKTVSVLFADLVSFSSKAEQLDPEDVRALLAPYYERLRFELERFGGTVEKFIGDAVVALFGAPVTHEDDPERAVRAALAIRDWATQPEVSLQLRIAVNTGGVLVALGARPGEGEGMASGDAVNTAARLQAAAPINGILVGETTYRATSHVINYRAADPVTAKGKGEPIPVWEAIEARSRFGSDFAGATRAPLIGRDRDLDMLTGLLARVRAERTTQLVTVTGVPGIGKSRLIAELFRSADADPGELVLWRQGRSLSYDEGVTYWALADIVKAHAGILETDSPEEAAEKLHIAVDNVGAEPADARWIEDHLRPLAGLGGSAQSSSTRSEAFTAWSRFFETLAESNPLILVFEDLHWADDNLLDFIEHLIDWVSDVPLLVVCSARPELLERRPSWGGGKRNAVTLSLTPLSEDETARLISSLAEHPVMSFETQQALIARADGNPLYAEQYVRMLAEHGHAEALPLPETVQGIIAARLDALPLDEKALLQSAAVVGKIFWIGALAAIAGSEPHGVGAQLHALERKEFIRKVRRSSMAGQAEYTFLHVLVRDVAYEQIPRGQRADKHLAAAEWIASLGRTEDNAEMLAHHYESALELRRAAGQPIDGRVAERALQSFRDAGDRALSLNAPSTAARYYQAALELAAAGSVERAWLVLSLSRARYVTDDHDPRLIEDAIGDFLEHGEREGAARAETLLGEISWMRGERDQAFEHLGRARELVAKVQLSLAKAEVIGTTSRLLMLASDYDEAIKFGREALEMAEQLGIDSLRAKALNNIGVSLSANMAGFAGIAELEQSIAIARAANAAADICRGEGNLAYLHWTHGQLNEANELWDRAIADAERFGQVGFIRWYKAAQSRKYEFGDWSGAIEWVDALIADVEAGSPFYLAPQCYIIRAYIRLGRDDADGAVADTERALELVRSVKDPQEFFLTIAQGALIFCDSGDAVRAGALASEFLAELTPMKMSGSMEALPSLAFALVALGRGHEFNAVPPPVFANRWMVSASAIAVGDLRHAAEVFEEMGAHTLEARARLELASTLLQQRRRSEADVELQRALTFYRSVGATRYIREGEALRAESA